MWSLLLLFSSKEIFATVESANILGICPTYIKSHNLMFEKFLNRLAEKGHEVDFATHFVNEKHLPRYNSLSLLGGMDSLVSNISIDAFGGLSHYEIVRLITKGFGADICKPNLQILENLKKSTKKYDLVITELFGSDCMLGFGHLFNAPTISITSSISLPWGNDRIGNPDNPSYIPNYFTPVSSQMNFFEKLRNTIELILSKFWFGFHSSKDSNKIGKIFFGQTLPNLEELAQNTSLILVNSHFSISHPRPTVPNFIEVGGLHIEKPKSLSKYFRDLVTSDTEGVIYLSMGSIILSETFDTKKLQDMFDAFAELPYRVLWRGSREKFPTGLKIPTNIHFVPWMPQIDVLCDPNVKLFISHGGLMGIQEAVYCGVPILGIPLFADQFLNVHNAERMGFALKVPYQDIKKQIFSESVRKLLNDLSYKKTALQVSLQFKDRPLSPLDEAVYWVEYVIRHRRAPQLRSFGADSTWYQYFLTDVSVIIFFCFFTLLYLGLIVLKSVSLFFILSF